MKAIIIILFMNYFLCYQMIYLNSFSLSSSESESKNKTHYLDISEFEQDDVMHLAIVVKDGEIDKIIHYGFSDNTSVSTNLLNYKVDTTSTEIATTKTKSNKSQISHSTPSYKYYFDIKKEENAKYILIQCTGYTGSGIEFSFMPMSSIGFYILFGVIALVFIAGMCGYIAWKKHKEFDSDNNIIGQKPEQTPVIPQDNQPTYSNY